MFIFARRLTGKKVGDAARLSLLPHPIGPIKGVLLWIGIGQQIECVNIGVWPPMGASSVPRSPWATTRSRPTSVATARPKPSPATTSVSPFRNPLPRPSSSAISTAGPRSGTTNRPPFPSSMLPVRPRSHPSTTPGSVPLAACAPLRSLSPRSGRRRPGASQKAR
jgi:hypothetical protein